MKIKALVALTLTLALGAAIPAAPTHAAVTIGVSPSLVELLAQPGGTGTVDVTVLNQGDEAFEAQISVIHYERVDASLSVPEWLTVSPESVQIEPGGSAIVTVSLVIPDDAAAGGHYAAIAIETGGADSSEEVTAISSRLGVPFLMTVDGDLERLAEIDQFAPVLEIDGRLGFRARVLNSGNVDWQATGEATITKGDGSEYGSLEFAQTRAYPLGSALLNTTSTLPMEAGAEYLVTTEIDYGADDPITTEAAFTFAQSLNVDGNVCENLSSGPTLSAALINGGDLGIMSAARMTIKTAGGQPIGQSNPVDPAVAWPNETTSVEADLADRLPTGDYILTVDVQTGASAELITTEIPFSIGGTGPNVAPICEQPASTPDAD